MLMTREEEEKRRGVPVGGQRGGGGGGERSDALPRQRCECSMRRERTNIFSRYDRETARASLPANEKLESEKQFLPFHVSNCALMPINWRGRT